MLEWNSLKKLNEYDHFIEYKTSLAEKAFAACRGFIETKQILKLKFPTTKTQQEANQLFLECILKHYIKPWQHEALQSYWKELTPQDIEAAYKKLHFLDGENEPAELGIARNLFLETLHGVLYAEKEEYEEAISKAWNRFILYLWQESWDLRRERTFLEDLYPFLWYYCHITWG